MIPVHGPAASRAARLARAWQRRGNQWCSRGDHAAARAAFDRAFVQAQSAWSASADDWLALWNDRAVLARYAGEFELAERLYAQALARAQGLGDPLSIAGLLHNLGGLAHARGDAATGEPLARKAAELSRSALGADHPRAVADAVAWAGLLDALGRQTESEPIYRRALIYWEQRGELDEVAVCCNNLGAVCVVLGQLAEARGHYGRAIEIKRSRLGNRHPDLAISLHNLALLLARLGERSSAIDLLREAMAIFSLRLAPTHPHYQRCQARLDALLASPRQDP